MSNVFDWENGQVNDVKTEIRERYPDVPFPDVYMDVLWAGINKDKYVDDRKAIYVKGIGTDEDHFAEVCSNHYKLLPHEVALYLFEDEMNSKLTPEYGPMSIDINLFQDGEKMKVDAIFKESKVAVRPGREISPKAMMKNSVNLEWVFSGHGGAYDWVCTNGMVSGHLAFRFSKKHRLNLDPVAQMQSLASQMRKMPEQFETWSKWAAIELQKQQAEEIIEALPQFSEKQTESLLALPEVETGYRLRDIFEDGKTVDAYTLHSIVTQHMTHEVSLTANRVEREEKVARVFAKKMKPHMKMAA